MATVVIPWKPWQKISFRFLFLFFAITSLLCLHLIAFIADLAFSKNGFQFDKPFKPLTGICHWLDKHIYHIGYDPKIHGSYPGDNHFGVAFYLTIILFSILVTIIWSILDKKRSSYERLYYWFCLYLRYVLALTVILYGIDKIIPIQMSPPNIAMLTEPYGHTDRFDVLWSFMGMSPGYMIFTGSFEVIAGLLLFFRRTAVAGYLLTIAIMANVVALNWFYNVPVKLFSTQLMIFALFLLAPYVKPIFQFFFDNGSNAPYSQKRFFFQTRWKKNLLVVILLLVPLVVILLTVISTYKRYAEEATNERKQKIYDVAAFIAKDTLPPLATDTMRWKRVLLFVFGNNFVVYNMQEKSQWYEFKIDSTRKTLTLNSGDDKAKWKIFHYSNPAKDQMQLAGKWKGKDISVLLKLSPVDSIPLNKEGLRFFQE